MAIVIVGLTSSSASAQVTIPLDTPGAYLVPPPGALKAGRNQIRPPHLEHTPYAFFPLDARTMHREGWVQVEATVMPDGSTRDCKIANAYPGRIYESTAMRACEGLRFTPASINGIPAEAYGVRVTDTFYFKETRGISRDHAYLFGRAAKALAATNDDEAETALAGLRKLRDSGNFNLTELARLSDLTARIALMKNNAIEANEENSRSLALGRFLDGQKALESAQQLRIIIYVKLGKYDEAVDYFDAWKQHAKAISPAMSNGIEQLRSKGFGKGVAYEVLTQAEIEKREDARNAALRK